MGCVVSSSRLAHSDDKELPQFVSAEDIRLVQESWLLVQQDMDNIGLIIFKRFFKDNRDLKRLFYTKLRGEDMEMGNIEEGEFDEDKLRMHGRIVMEALGAAVECLNDSEHLTALLIGIGERHVMYGVKSDMVPRLWPAIVTTLEEQLGDNFDNKVGKAWERVFQYIGGKVIEGINRWKKKK
ncbi:uncharacterized protein LOC123545361 [Mercenaria mercenaria]|uniref:uncharacterized protein LOC123545361 n=1 Tax=Mercenaria mercenaria TaxID=6596 RepID=UPI001E1DC1A2|nr:uncharacterized protein LOC123545361 [Mercenaria mercenaria]